MVQWPSLEILFIIIFYIKFDFSVSFIHIITHNEDWSKILKLFSAIKNNKIN